MSCSSKKPMSNGASSQKKKALDRFIPHSVAKNLFNAPEHHPQQTNYQELLNQELLQQSSSLIIPKILHFHEQEHK